MARHSANKTRNMLQRVPKPMRLLAVIAVVVIVASGLSAANALRRTTPLRIALDRDAVASAQPQSGAYSRQAKHSRQSTNASNDAGELPTGSDEQSLNDAEKTQSTQQSNPESLWRDPTGGTQPDLSTLEDVSVVVDIAAQRAHVRSANQDVYVMTISTGMNDSTPRGDYVVQGRGEHFYNAGEGMGADYWVNFLGNTFLFHSVPTGVNFGDYIAGEGAKLGQPASHGCVRLSVADAKWLYEQLPDGTPIHIG